MKYGREDEDWDLLVEEGQRFLIELARLGRPTSYTEFNAVLGQRTGLRQFDFDQQPERAAIGQLLGEIVDNTRGDSGVMLSALVQYLGANDAGPGFYKLAVQLGLLEKHASAAAKDRFWIEQVKLAYQEFGGR